MMELSEALEALPRPSDEAPRSVWSAWDDLHTLAHSTLSWPVIGTWTPGTESAAARLLVRIFEHLAEPPARLPAGLFQVSELLDVQPWGDDEDAIELWRTRWLRFTGHRIPHILHLARMDAVAEEGGGVGWHIHVYNPERGKTRKRLGYRFLFDAQHGQEHLAWERHNRNDPRKGAPYGDPATSVLPPRRAASLHQACEHAVFSQLQLRHVPFESWASLFAPTGAKSYVAYSEAFPDGVPDDPVAWSQLAAARSDDRP